MGWRYNCPNVYINGGIWTTIEHDPLFISSSDSEKKFLEKIGNYQSHYYTVKYIYLYGKWFKVVCKKNK